MPRSLVTRHRRNKRAKSGRLYWQNRRINDQLDVPNILPRAPDVPEVVADQPQIANDASDWEELSDWEAEDFFNRGDWCSTTYSNKPKIKMLPGFLSSDECERIEAHKLAVETEQKPKCIIEGNRIVELGYVLEWAMNLQYTHSKICTTGKLHIKEEIRKAHGLVSTIVFKCDMCSQEYLHETENPNRKNSIINIGAVWGTLATGSTHSHMSEFLSCMDIPTMPANMFYKIENELGKEWEASILNSMEIAGQREKEIAKEKKQLCSNGVPWITVYVDGSWSKRSYGTNFTALSGMVAIIGKNTGCVLFVGVRNKFCIICSRAEKLEQSPKDHVCFKNWSGSAPAMEADMVVEGFNSSESMHGVRYLKFIADGDSSVYAKIVEKVSYGRQVKKVECTNHVLKNYGKRLRTIKKDTHINLKGRKLLTIHKIDQLTKRAKCSIYEHSKKIKRDVNVLRQDLRNGLHHVFGNHAVCRSEICNIVGDVSNNQIPELKSTTLFNHLNGALDLLVRKTHLLIENENNNRAERLMNIVSRFNQGKRLNLIQRGSYQRRVHLAGLRYNEGGNWHSTPYKHVTGQSPGKHFQEFIEKHRKQHEWKVRKRLLSIHEGTPRSKKVKRSQEINRDYGPNAAEPDEDEGMVQQEVDDIVERLKVNEEERNQIQVDSVGQFGNEVFESERTNRLTASMFGQVIKRRTYTPCHNLVKTILKHNHFYSEATEYGILKEKVAIGLFEQKTGLIVKSSGFWVDLTNGYLGASPDGLIGDDALIEVKCLYSANKLDMQPTNIEPIIDKMKSKICLEKHDNKIRLKRNHNYYYQIQGQLNITEKSKCYFVVYVNDNIDLFIEEIKRDTKFWNNVMLPQLSRFFKECIAPEIVRKNIGKGKRCLDPKYITDAIKQFEQKKKPKGN